MKHGRKGEVWVTISFLFHTTCVSEQHVCSEYRSQIHRIWLGSKLIWIGSQPSSLCQLFKIQPPHSTRSSSTLLRCPRVRPLIY